MSKVILYKKLLFKDFPWSEQFFDVDRLIKADRKNSWKKREYFLVKLYLGTS